VRQAERVDELEDPHLRLAEELPAGIVGLAIRARDGLEAPPCPIARLEHADSKSGGAHGPRRDQARESRSDDDDVGGAPITIAHIL
jgi:hypothetical protein